MRLESLELQGFKTFPDKTKLTFDSGISAVVGPNGSGKSNLSDAVRWVLGEQSTHALRCSRMEDIVFGGTPSRRAQGFAQVTLTMDNRSRALPFDGDTVAITRRYYRSGESEYQINHATVRLRDIHELLMDTGLGRDGYCLIGQGKIDSIVSARSEDRREMFEEAAGISRYRYRKEESERKLSQAEENLVRLRDILGELESRVGPLREQAEKAKRYLAFAEEKQTLEIGLWLHTLNHSGRILREQEDKLTITRQQQEDITRQTEQLDAAMEQNFQQANACLVRMEELRSRSAQKEEEAVRLEGSISVLQNDVQHNCLSVERLVREREELAETNRQMLQAQEELRLALAQNQQRLEQQQRESKGISEELEQLHHGMAQSSGKLEQDTRRLQELHDQFAQAGSAVLSAETTQQELALRLQALQEERERQQRAVQELETVAAQEESKAREIDEAVRRLQEQLRAGEARLEQLRHAEEQAKKQRDQAHLDAQAQERRIHLLEELERNLEGFAHSVKAILRESSKGAFSGIHGPVSRLLTVPPEYAVAIETALGASMQHLVVDTEQDAKAAIRFLKEKNGGRATFLPLSTIRGNWLSETGLEKCPGFVGIAGQLCSCEPQYQGILRSLLGRIVVARDLNDATALARKYGYRFRVVTLDGQVIHPGGSLTGGSLTKQAGLLSRAAEIERLKRQWNEQTKQEQQLLERWQEQQEQTRQAVQEMERLRASMSVTQEARVEQTGRWSRARSDWETRRLQEEELRREHERTQQRQENLEQVKQQAQTRQTLLGEQRDALQRALHQLDNSRAAHVQRADQLNRDLQERQLLMLSDEKDQAALLLSLQDGERRQQETERRIQALQEEQRTLEETNRALEQQIQTSRDTAQTWREEARQAKAESAKAQAQRMELEQQSLALRNQEREQSHTRENLAREIARLEERKAGVQKEYDEIIRRLWEDYTLTRREAEQIAVPAQDTAKAQRRLNEVKNAIRALGAVNPAAVEEYQEVSERYEFFTAQMNDVETSREELRRLIRELSGQMQTLFLERFGQINQYFRETFVELFGGGKAQLELENPEELLTCGIQISVQPPGKLVSNLELLSGGEKALVAIALYFAIMKVNPPPFCVMDEIEAALDESNVERFASALRRMNDRTQFVVITHRRGTMEEADLLYGVTMQEEGVSKLLEMKLSELEETLGIQ